MEVSSNAVGHLTSLLYWFRFLLGTCLCASEVKFSHPTINHSKNASYFFKEATMTNDDLWLHLTVAIY